MATNVSTEIILELSKRCAEISESGKRFFSEVNRNVEGKIYGPSPREVMSQELLAQAESLRRDVRVLTVAIIEAAQASPLMSREDINDATTAMKMALAALLFREYRRWDTQLLHDEDTVLGVREAGQEETDTNSWTASRSFDEAMKRLGDLAALLVPGKADTVVGEDYKFGKMAVEEARKSIGEDGRVHPLVGAVVVKDGEVLARAHRGELPGNHAEYIALEKKLANVDITECTVYTTLEPCTTRIHPKIPCSDRLIERKVSRVVIGMLDPNPVIRGRGMWKLQESNIAVDIFPHELTRQIQDLNREFTRCCKDSDRPDSDVKIQLAAFMTEGYRIASSIEYSNPASVSEKADWEQKVEHFLKTKLDESYAVQFRFPNREITAYPSGINPPMRVHWSGLKTKLDTLSDFISKLRR